MKNKLIIAAAGSGKTTFLINNALKQYPEKVLITTYTEANAVEILQKITNAKGYIPSNITVQTWFSFLLQHGVRPYQNTLNESIDEVNIGFYLTAEQSGKKLDDEGKPILLDGRPIYWSEDKNFMKHYFTKGFKIYSDKLSKFIVRCNESCQNEIINRISRIFSHIYIDEIQDLAGYDLDLIKLLFGSKSSILLVGDPRQVTYLTHNPSRFRKYSEGRIKDFICNELGKKLTCEIDETSLNISHRNNQLICNYSAKLYPDLSQSTSCDCINCRDGVTDHEGIFLIKPNAAEQYLVDFKPIQLIWNSRTRHNINFPSNNFGQSKGATYERVLIYPTQDMQNWINNNQFSLKNQTKAKLYVAITRAKRSVAIVMDYDNNHIFDGISKYS